MIKKFVIGMMVLFLAACGTSPVRDDSPANDLDALVLAVKQEAKPRYLPNGQIHCLESSVTNRARDRCANELEDTLFLSELDKRLVILKVENAVKHLKLARNPCTFWEKITYVERCRVTSP